MAVYTPITRLELDAFWQNYDLPAVADFQGILAGISNSNYIVTDISGTKRILTLFEERTPAADLPYFISLMQHMAACDISCPQPIMARDGQAVRLLAGKPAAIVSFLAGASVTQPTVAECAVMGTMLAKIHLAGLQFPPRRANSMNRDVWLDLLQRSNNGTAAWADMWQIAQEICANWPQNTPNYNFPTGAIHADLFPDNVFFATNALTSETPTSETMISGVIDWYFACTDFLAYDLAITLNAWCAVPAGASASTNHGGALEAERTNAMLQAYQALLPLNPAEIAALPLLLQGAALRIFATRHYDWVHQQAGVIVTAKDPADYAQLLYRHRQHPLAVADIIDN